MAKNKSAKGTPAKQPEQSPPKHITQSSVTRPKSSLCKRLSVWQLLAVAAAALVVSGAVGGGAVVANNPDLLQSLPAMVSQTDPQLIAARLVSLLRNNTGAFTPPDTTGLFMRHPVVLVPGFINTGLELWRGKPCAQRYFRQRMWGTVTMMEVMLLRSECWVEHMSLNPETGLDPEGVRLRPAAGLESADYLLPGYWVWARIIESLSMIGYDSNDMHLAAYDWRLSFPNVEARDGAFTKLKSATESLVAFRGKKCVFVAHSMGAVYTLYFFNWAEQRDPGWVDRNIHATVNLAGALLGVPKAISALFSGEMRDSAQLGPLSIFLVDSLFSKNERRDMFRTWGSLSALLPKGGNSIWGDASNAPDDTQEVSGSGNTHGVILTFSNGTKLTMEESLRMLQNQPNSTQISWNSFGKTQVSAPGEKCPQRSWANPLECPLPKSKMQMYCLYGVGKTTERSYHYMNTALEGPIINNTVSNTAANVISGVQEADGDGTVPLVSLGYMCAKGWRSSSLNPGGATVVTREYRHDPSGLRGGPNTADHVDIMGNTETIGDLLSICAGKQLDDRFLSRIREIAERVKF